MRRLLRGILTLALLWATVPAYAANDLTLDQGDGTFQKLGGIGPAARTVLDSLLACERLQDQASKGHCVIVDATHLTIISTTSAVTIGGGVANDTYLKRIGTTAATAGACVVTGFADSTGAAKSLTFPLGFTGKEFGAARNSAGALTITCSDAGDDDKVYVEWWPAL